MSAVERRFLLWCIILYALPVAGVLLPQGVVQLMVPRDLVSSFVVFHFNTGFPAIGADSYGNMYKVSIAATLVIVSVLASLAYCLHWVFTTGRKLVGPTLERLLLPGVAAAAALAALALFIPGSVDDLTTKHLFDSAGVLALKPPIDFNWDGRILGSLIYGAYGIAALTVAIAAAARLSFRAAKAHESPPTDTVLRVVLYLMTAVLITAMITARLRFDVGQAALGPAPTKELTNAAYAAYQTIASSIMAYWATVLSLGLAFIYLPGALLINFASAGGGSVKIEEFFEFNQENFMRLIRVAAIASPPIINKLIEAFASAPHVA